MTDYIKRLEILLGDCREPIPVHFFRTFEDKPFDECAYCRRSLLTDDTHYTISKFYSMGQLQEEIAVCHYCQSQMKNGYSAESLRTLRSIYSETYVKQRLEILYHIEAGEDKVARMLDNCSICSILRDEYSTYFEYALCIGNELVFFTHPSMVCENCAIKIYNSLSNETREYKHRFMQEHFRFPPDGSDSQKSDFERSNLWLLG